MAARPFAKYQGLGNDFIVLDAAEWPDVGPALARDLCDRHLGVGGDGVLCVDRTEMVHGRVRMVIFNADGSRPEMCGNGVRCVAAWLVDRGDLAEGSALVVDSDAGPRPVRVRAAGADGCEVEVAMGTARVDATVAEAAGLAVRAVDMGNPHGVVFAEPDDVPAVVRSVGALPVFPQGVNVELVTPTPRGFRVRVHERGVGWTQACGTGACAVVAAAVDERRWPADQPAEVELDGGPLSIRVSREGAVTMTGPARRAFVGLR